MPREPKQKTVTNANQGGINFLYNSVIPYNIPQTFDGNLWRYVAAKQPVIVDCVTTLTMHVAAKPWDIRAKDSDKNDELKDSIEYHRKIFLDFGGIGYLNGLDLIIQDFEVIPFGTAVETVRYSDRRLFKLVNIDGATLFPTGRDDLPVMQKVGTKTVYYDEDEIVRMYQSPRPEIEYRGWGKSPVEKIYMAMELLSRGDKYYAQMLLDTPEAGLLDLGDMSKDSAEKWLESFRNLMSGIDAFKIPVLYQHTTPAKWIPFGRPPTDMLFDKITFKYAQLVCAAFGLTTGDIGLTSQQGGSLSGQIRDERHSRSTGYASIKAKIKEFFDRILPDELEFSFIDTDDELLVAKGRARSANAVAGRNLIESGAISPNEWRKQLKADGLLTIPLPEEPAEEEFDILKEIDGTADQLELQKEQLDIQKKISNQRPSVGATQGGKGLNKQRNVRGGKLESVQGKEPVPASGGGQGEIKSEASDNISELEAFLAENFKEIKSKINPTRCKRLIKSAIKQNYDLLKSLSETDKDWKVNYLHALFSLDDEINAKSTAVQIKELSAIADKDSWWILDINHTLLGDILAKSYLAGLEDSAKEIQNALYEEGLTDVLDVTKEVTLSDSDRDDVYAYALALSAFIDSGTDFFVKRLSLGSVAEAIDIPEFFEKVKAGQTLETLLEDDRFIESATQVFQSTLESVLNSRIVSIANNENLRLYNRGTIRQYKSAGLTKKALVAVGSGNSCEVCREAEELGFVPIDHLYKSKTGADVDVPPLHPDCRHVLKFSRKELSKIDKDYFKK